MKWAATRYSRRTAWRRVRRPGVERRHAEPAELGHRRLDHPVLVGDPRDELRVDAFDQRAEELLLVGRVVVQKLEQPAGATGERVERFIVGGVDPAGLTGDGEDLGPQALVDVAVEVEGHVLESSDRGIGGRREALSPRADPGGRGHRVAPTVAVSARCSTAPAESMNTASQVVARIRSSRNGRYSSDSYQTCAASIVGKVS